MTPEALKARVDAWAGPLGPWGSMEATTQDAREVAEALGVEGAEMLLVELEGAFEAGDGGREASLYECLERYAELHGHALANALLKRLGVYGAEADAVLIEFLGQARDPGALWIACQRLDLAKADEDMIVALTMAARMIGGAEALAALERALEAMAADRGDRALVEEALADLR